MAKIKAFVDSSLSKSDGTTYTVASVIVAVYMGIQMFGG
jgi:hypothetical protein